MSKVEINHNARPAVVLCLILCLTGVAGIALSQATQRSGPFIEYEGLPQQHNPDALSIRPLPITLLDEVDFHIFRYHTPNPLQIKLLIGNRKGRRWTLKVETDKQDLLYLETQRMDWSWQLLNLEELPVGCYRLLISAGPYQLVHPFTITRMQPVEWTNHRTIQF